MNLFLQHAKSLASAEAVLQAAKETVKAKDTDKARTRRSKRLFAIVLY